MAGERPHAVAELQELRSLSIAELANLEMLGTARRGYFVEGLGGAQFALPGAVERLRSMPAITELRSAVIWTKGLSKFTPDYSVEFLPTNPWIHQPFETYDSMGPAKLLEKWKI